MPSRTPNADLRTFLKRLPLALAAAIAIWFAVRPMYNPALCASAQWLARFGEFPAASLVVHQGNNALLGRSDMRATSEWLKVPLTQIDFNLVPFLALVFALPGWLAGRGWRRLLAAVGVLAASHVLGLVWQIKALEALSMGPWSRATYSSLARNVYGTLRYFFDIPVTFALPLVLWVGAYPEKVFKLVGFSLPAKR
ncbi:MAG: hypothetical protein B7Z68_10700 [Acidobacteria bacterium 21-70-11]|nr:MAG: hypothetical protein B7Z68_10700 [Acidobacteria bacterium 21-70-11]OYW01880.1 MAG: hypothetical protein B7Z61_12070 [Acidobacteria bacterium 37-71-11]HQT93307.1 hypothetical protein [Thermoanaerobaculaceae bacterium]HQU33399.1 hypothetical protein [Thermoanaerobaculaceae bacterium]